jgi:hypothetical protein
MRVVVPVEHVLSHCCNMCYFIYISGPASCLTLVSSRGGCCFSSFYDFFFIFLLCCLLCLLEYRLGAWLLGAVVLSRVVETGLRFLLCNVGSQSYISSLLFLIPCFYIGFSYSTLILHFQRTAEHISVFLFYTCVLLFFTFYIDPALPKYTYVYIVCLTHPWGYVLHWVCDLT